jgi:hypothetical protein
MENNYQLSRIHNYINGLMSKEEMHTLEREALDDPFLQDAIDGYALQKGVDTKSLSLLQKRLANRIEEQPLGRNRRFYGWQRLAIGATAAVMFVTVCLLLLIKYIPQRQTAGLREVEIMQENTFSISLISSQSNAEPRGGWSSFEAYIQQNLKEKNYEKGSLIVTFDIDKDGTPIQIQEEKNKKEKHKAFDKLKKLITDGPKWHGDQAAISIDFH